MDRCYGCYGELTSVDIDGICISCRNAGFDFSNQPVVSQYGWICPRCQAIHAPFVRHCYCPPPSITSDSTQLDIKFNE